MSCRNIEIKARCYNPARVRAILKSHKADFIGTDQQIDTYFKVSQGRFKLREGRIENALIFYKRSNQKNSKRCDAFLYTCPDRKTTKKILSAACGVLAVVNKKREIYFLGNVKFHIDRVKKLGSFVEIEAQDPEGKISLQKLKRQCEFFQKLLGICPEDLLSDSYSDQLLKLKMGLGTRRS